jgi:hypothetical protein
MVDALPDPTKFFNKEKTKPPANVVTTNNIPSTEVSREKDDNFTHGHPADQRSNSHGQFVGFDGEGLPEVKSNDMPNIPDAYRDDRNGRDDRKHRSRHHNDSSSESESSSSGSETDSSDGSSEGSSDSETDSSEGSRTSRDSRATVGENGTMNPESENKEERHREDREHRRHKKHKMSSEEIKRRKREIMIIFSKYEKRKKEVPFFTFESSLDDMEFALEKFEKNLKFERDIKFYRILIIGVCWIFEKTVSITGHDLGLEHWWKHVQANIVEFDEYLEEMVKEGTNWPPEIRLVGAIALSGLSYSAMNHLPHLAKVMSTSAGEFFSAISGLNDQRSSTPAAMPNEMRGPVGVDFLLDEIKEDKKRAERSAHKATKKHR